MAKKQAAKQYTDRKLLRICPKCGNKMDLIFLRVSKKKYVRWYCETCNTYLKKTIDNVENRQKDAQ